MSFKNGGLYYIPQCSISIPVKDKFAICVSAEDNIFYLVNSCDERRPYAHEIEYVVYIERHHFKELSHRSYINIKNIKFLPEKDLAKAMEYSIMPNDLWLRIKSQAATCKTLQGKYKIIIMKQNKFKR